MANDDERWFQLVLIWERDPARFAEYMTAVAPIVVRHGGAAEHQFTPTGIHAEGLKLPSLVNLVHSPNRAAFDTFVEDPEFQQVRVLRDESIDMLDFGGYLVRATPVEPTPQRVYGIEIVRFTSGSRDAYARYETDGEPLMASYGYAVEYVLDVIAAPDGHHYDLVKVSSFPSLADRQAFEKDPGHARVEQELYPAAVDTAIWIDATRFG